MRSVLGKRNHPVPGIFFNAIRDEKRKQYYVYFQKTFENDLGL